MCALPHYQPSYTPTQERRLEITYCARIKWVFGAPRFTSTRKVYADIAVFSIRGVSASQSHVQLVRPQYAALREAFLTTIKDRSLSRAFTQLESLRALVHDMLAITTLAWPKVVPWYQRTLSRNPFLPGVHRKDDAAISVQRTEPLSFSELTYPNRIHIYTDGSIRDCSRSCGAAYYIPAFLMTWSRRLFNCVSSTSTNRVKSNRHDFTRSSHLSFIWHSNFELLS